MRTYTVTYENFTGVIDRVTITANTHEEAMRKADSYKHANAHIHIHGKVKTNIKEQKEEAENPVSI